MILGVTGKYCSGKNTLVRYLSRAGFAAVDVDKIGHLVLKEKKTAIADEFGLGILDERGEIDRKALGKLVFRNRERLEALERVLHPAMVERVKKIVKERKGPIAINAAILFKMGLHLLCDTVVCVSAPFTIRLKRALERDSLPFKEVVKRLLSQRGICLKFKRGDVDIYFIRNSGSQKDLEKKIERFLAERGLTPEKP